MDRRKFLRTVFKFVSAMLLFNSHGIKGMAGTLPSKYTIPTHVLGKTGVSVPVLGLGGSIDWSNNQSLLNLAYQSGVNLWDTGNSYNGGKSEFGYGNFFKKYPEKRKNIFLFTKASVIVKDTKMLSNDLNSSLERLHTDYIDLYGLPGLNDPSVLTSDIKEWAEQKKREGKIRFFGFSTHQNMAGMLKRAAEIGWIDVVLTSYNYQLAFFDRPLKKAIETCSKAGIGIIGMKSQALKYANYKYRRYLPYLHPILNYFALRGYTPEQAKLKFVLESKNIDCCLSHINNMTILEENIAAASNNLELTSDHFDYLYNLAHIDRQFYCSGCMKCENAMKNECRIPDVLRYLMYYNNYGEKDRAKDLFMMIPENIKSKLSITDYSVAESICPNKINIGLAMKEACKILA